MTAPADVNDILDGQRRTAPFHFNTTARAQAGAPLGMKVPDRVHTRGALARPRAARMTLQNHLATRDAEGVRPGARRRTAGC